MFTSFVSRLSILIFYKWLQNIFRNGKLAIYVLLLICAANDSVYSHFLSIVSKRKKFWLYSDTCRPMSQKILASSKVVKAVMHKIRRHKSIFTLAWQNDPRTMLSGHVSTRIFFESFLAEQATSVQYNWDIGIQNFL